MKLLGVTCLTLLFSTARSVKPAAKHAHDWNHRGTTKPTRHHGDDSLAGGIGDFPRLMRREGSGAESFLEGRPINVSTPYLLQSSKASMMERLFSSDVIIHNCNSSADCLFQNCGDEATGVTAECSNKNCFKYEVNAECDGQSDGFETTDGDICVGGKAVSNCQPSNCDDVAFPDDPTDPTTVQTCDDMLKIDTTWCTQTTAQDIVNVYCRGTCQVCNRVANRISMEGNGEFKLHASSVNETKNGTSEDADEADAAEESCDQFITSMTCPIDRCDWTDSECQAKSSVNYVLWIGLLLFIIGLAAVIAFCAVGKPQKKEAPEPAKEEEGEAVAETEAEEEGEEENKEEEEGAEAAPEGETQEAVAAEEEGEAPPQPLQPPQ